MDLILLPPLSSHWTRSISRSICISIRTKISYNVNISSLAWTVNELWQNVLWQYPLHNPRLYTLKSKDTRKSPAFALSRALGFLMYTISIE